MRDYFLIPQENDRFCVAACLQAIMDSYNIKISQKDISDRLDLDDAGMFYVQKGGIFDFMKEKNFNYEWFEYNKTPFNEPDMVLQNIHDENKHILVLFKRHAHLLLDFKDPKLFLLDPDNTGILEENYFKMIGKMSEQNRGGFGLITKIDN